MQGKYSKRENTTREEKNIDGVILYETLLEKRMDTKGETFLQESKIERNVPCLEIIRVKGKILWKEILKRSMLEEK